MSAFPVRKLAGILSLLVVLAWGPSGEAFARYLGAHDHPSQNGLQVDLHLHAQATETAGDTDTQALHAPDDVGCVVISLPVAATVATATAGIGDVSPFIPVSEAAFLPSPERRSSAVLASPMAGPARDPRLVTHRSVVLLN